MVANHAFGDILVVFGINGSQVPLERALVHSQLKHQRVVSQKIEGISKLDDISDSMPDPYGLGENYSA
jgi:hypothetical protein